MSCSTKANHHPRRHLNTIRPHHSIVECKSINYRHNVFKIVSHFIVSLLLFEFLFNSCLVWHLILLREILTWVVLLPTPLDRTVWSIDGNGNDGNSESLMNWLLAQTQREEGTTSSAIFYYLSCHFPSWGQLVQNWHEYQMIGGNH